MMIQENLVKLPAEKKKAPKPTKNRAKGKQKTAPSNVVSIMDASRKSLAGELKGLKAG